MQFIVNGGDMFHSFKKSYKTQELQIYFSENRAKKSNEKCNEKRMKCLLYLKKTTNFFYYKIESKLVRSQNSVHKYNMQKCNLKFDRMIAAYIRFCETLAKLQFQFFLIRAKTKNLCRKSVFSHISKPC